MQSIELFSGAGGLALGLEQAGFNTVALFERDADACAALRLNRPKWNIVEGDVREVDFSQFGPVITGDYWKQHGLTGRITLPPAKLQRKIESLRSGNLLALASRWNTVRDALSDLPDLSAGHAKLLRRLRTTLPA